MKCPHCTVSFHDEWKTVILSEDVDCYWSIQYCQCPMCNKLIIKTISTTPYRENERVVYPKASSRAPLAPEVNDQSVVSDYTESCLVLNDSPKASAALSRRALQYILREKVGVKASDLNNEIQQVIDENLLPAELAGNLDVIRNIGNFASHPIKSKSTGEIVDVEPHEAEWNLEVLEDLIEYTFVRPARSQARKQAFSQKLIDSGKPELK